MSYFQKRTLRSTLRHILITGKPRVGKTSLIKDLIPHINSCGGFYTQEITESGRRTGFEIITLDGKRGILAKKGIRSPFRLGSYGIDINDLENIGVEAVGKAIDKKDIIIIDEIGKMELFSDRFKEVVLKALDSGKRVLGVIHREGIPFLKRIKERKDVLVLELTQDNYSNVLDIARKELGL